MINWELVWSASFLIVGSGFIIILLLLSSVYFQRTHQDRRLKLMIYLSISFVLALLISFSSIVVTSRNEFCINCHEMRPYAEAFKKSVHSEMSCYGCHGGQGLAGFFIHKIEVIKEPYLHLTNAYEKPINGSSDVSKEMSETICERCHDLNQRKVTARKDLIINHKKHKENGIACPICHNRVAHPNIQKFNAELGSTSLPQDLRPAAGFEKEQFYPDRMKMRYCMKCHTGTAGEKKPSKACGTCHPSKYIKPPKNHQVPGFLRPVPNQSAAKQVVYNGQKGRSKALHALMASVDKEYCQSCHETKFCYSCHQTKMPHPKTNWKKEHGKIGQSAPNTCQTCHGEQNFCNRCHHDYDPKKGPWYSVTPGTSYHPIIVKKRGAESCFECHQATYCAHCHVTGNPQ